MTNEEWQEQIEKRLEFLEINTGLLKRIAELEGGRSQKIVNLGRTYTGDNRKPQHMRDLISGMNARNRDYWEKVQNRR